MNTMSASPVEQASASRGQPSRRTVDAPTRAFHWLMALCFTGAYLTSEGEAWRLVHVTLGYSMAGLIVARLIWGLVGPRPSRLTGWASRLKPLAKGLAAGASLRPALSMLAIVGLLMAGVATVASGITMEQEWGSSWLTDAVSELHEGAGNAMLALVLGHLAMVFLGVMFKGPAQVWSMVTGRMPGAGPDLVRRNRAWLGLALISVVLAFWGWQGSSQPLFGSGVSQGHEAHHAHGGDDDDD